METNVPIKITAHDQLCIERVPNRPCGIVIFGASGDLAHRKLLPALFHLYSEKLLPSKFFLLGTGRKIWSEAEFKEYVYEVLRKGKRKADAEKIKNFMSFLSYTPCNYLDPHAFVGLKRAMETQAEKHGTAKNAIFYLSIPPAVYAPTIENLTKAGLLYPDNSDAPSVQVVLEKPFGSDLESARSLSEETLRGLSEKQVYRIDHYLGKETVQNILMFRFANSIFEPVWNCDYIDHVQITAGETLGVEHRAGYYDTAGVLRDMFQNHMLELLALVAMESPESFEANHYRDEKVKVIQALRPIPHNDIENHFVRGQYAGYLKEKGVNPQSETETFAALKLFVNTPRWEGVPFYLRSGKRLKEQNTEIIIQFKHIEHSIFSRIPSSQFPPNKLHIRIQPHEGIQLCFNAKHPGPKMCMATLGLEFNYHNVFKEKDLAAYERLILDCMHVDPTLFVREDMVEMSWAFVESLLQVVRENGRPRLETYPAGSWGPEEADALIRRDGRAWGI